MKMRVELNVGKIHTQERYVITGEIDIPDEEVLELLHQNRKQTEQDTMLSIDSFFGDINTGAGTADND